MDARSRTTLIYLLAHASASHGGNQMQVDAMVVRGLNRNTPDLGLAFGLSLRH